MRAYPQVEPLSRMPRHGIRLPPPPAAACPRPVRQRTPRCLSSPAAPRRPAGHQILVSVRLQTAAPAGIFPRIGKNPQSLRMSGTDQPGKRRGRGPTAGMSFALTGTTSFGDQPFIACPAGLCRTQRRAAPVPDPLQKRRGRDLVSTHPVPRGLLRDVRPGARPRDGARAVVPGPADHPACRAGVRSGRGTVRPVRRLGSPALAGLARRSRRRAAAVESTRRRPRSNRRSSWRKAARPLPS